MLCPEKKLSTGQTNDAKQKMEGALERFAAMRPTASFVAAEGNPKVEGTKTQVAARSAVS